MILEAVTGLPQSQTRNMVANACGKLSIKEKL
jgi:hypothetical protein